jgi:carboxypeptidase C (cathepsin A)
MKISCLLISLLLLGSFAFGQTQQTKEAPKPPAKDASSVPEPIVTKHSIRVGGSQLNYTVTTGYLPIADDQGKPEARIFFMAYTRDDAPAGRPLMFSFNGGPGSASVWLHLGALGPKRVKMMPNGFMPPAPYELVDNESTWLTDTDLVFIDPVGTGYSRAEDPKNTKFFSLKGDLESVGEFIRLYLSRYKRWTSPLYMVGESYGTTRASGLSGYLIEKGIAFNGIVLVSTVMNFQTIRFADGNDLPLVLILPSYTSTAWYHKKLAPDLQNKPLNEILKLAESFAIDRYAPGLLKAGNLSASERSALVSELSRFTGLSERFVDRNNMRIELGEFMKELLKNEKRSVGRLDSRFTGIDKEPAGDGTDFDPSMTAIRPPYTATFNDYVRRELGFESDLEYYILGGGVGRWDWNVNNGYADTSGSLRSALQKNPFMKVFIGAGYYDMATPYFAMEYTLANMNLEPSLRANISTKYYEAGHMMYIEQNSLGMLKRDVMEFVRATKR